MVVTGSWDKTIKYWDLRQSTPVGSLTCEERVYSMDVKGKLLVIATADRHLQVVDLNNPTTFFRSIPSPLKHQTRVVSCFIDSSGFAVGGIEGRCGCQYVAEKDQKYVLITKMYLDADNPLAVATSPSDVTETNLSTITSMSTPSMPYRSTQSTAVY